MEAAWREDKSLKGRFNPDYPDDLQVLVHDGGPRMTDHPYELMWVRVVGTHGPAYAGLLLNAPHGLTSVKQGDKILFMGSETSQHPFRVTERYLVERASWEISPCNKCGMAELFDAPSDLIARVFPDLSEGAAPEVFTSLCPLCGGVQFVSSKALEESDVAPPKRKWWQFWK